MPLTRKTMRVIRKTTLKIGSGLGRHVSRVGNYPKKERDECEHWLTMLGASKKTPVIDKPVLFESIVPQVANDHACSVTSRPQSMVDALLGPQHHR
jgi:hypothetical protein